MTVSEFPALYAQSRRFTTGAPRTFKVRKHGGEVLFLRSKGELDPVLCLWAVNLESGIERLVVDPASLEMPSGEIPEAELARRERARESANGIVGYSLSTDGTKACFALEGALIVADVDSGKALMAPTASAVFDPRFSPDGSSVAYVSGQTLRRFVLASEEDHLLAGPNSHKVLDTDNDCDNQSWGSAEFVAAEEMGRSRGYWWAPDSESVLVTMVDVAPVDSWWIADPAHPHKGASENRYPAAGTNNATVELWYLHSQDGTTDAVQVDWDEHGVYEYLADVVWSSSHSSGPLVVRQTRDQRTTSIATINLETGSVSERQTISNDDWVELIPGSPTIHDLGLLTVEDFNEADHRALCLDGEPLTDSSLQVRAIIGTSDSVVTFTASPEPTEVHIYTLALDSELPNKDLERLTSEPGVHNASLSEGRLVVSRATPGSAGTVTSVEGKTIANLATKPPMAADPAFFEFGPRNLSSAVFLPSDHDGKTPLPVLLDPYGGPHAQRVLKSHNPHLVSRWFAEQGFAVLVTDGRGTPGRGPQFEREVWGDLAAPVLEDQLDALDAAAEHFGFLDLDRVGIRGWSFGGYLAALAALRAPERIHAAIAGAPVTTWRLYDTHYTERYLGHPADHPNHYDQTDLIKEADKLERPLLLIHGLADDNVVAAHTLQLSTALLVAGRAHQVLPLSGVTHMTPQVAIAQNLLELQLTFLKEHLTSELA